MYEKEKLEAFESWLLDDEDEKRTIKKYSTISVAVRSGDYIRIYKTNAFTIRALVVMMQRYNPQWEILAVKDGEFITDCPTWTHYYCFHPEDEPIEKLISHYSEYSRRELLRENDYRTAINKYYINCAEVGKYPSKSPFKNIKVWTADEFPLEIRKHPFFVADADNPMGADILRYYDGRRISRYVNGIKVDGYYITSPRIMVDGYICNEPEQ